MMLCPRFQCFITILLCSYEVYSGTASHYKNLIHIFVGYNMHPGYMLFDANMKFQFFQMNLYQFPRVFYFNLKFSYIIFVCNS